MTLILVLVASLLGSFGSVAVAALLFRGRGAIAAPVKTAVLSYATGSLLGAALLGMIPHALQGLTAQRTMATVLGGIAGFFILEKLLVWRHCHESDCQAHAQAGPLILAGDAVHNAIDGAAIALAFQQSWALGTATTLAVVAHEIPQEIGDIMILIHHGWSRQRAILYNTLASLTTVPGALVAWWAGRSVSGIAPYALAISAASFLYIALADLTPDHRAQTRLSTTCIQVAGIGAGVATIALVHLVAAALR